VKRLTAGRGILLCAALVLASQAPNVAQAQSAPQALVIGVDHADPANQQPEAGRVFEYTDFFSREASIHSGDTLDFRFAPGSFHVIALAPSEAAARATYPVAFSDAEDSHVAPSTGFPKIVLGPGNGPIQGGSVGGGGQVGGPNDMPSCGLTVVGQKPCTFASASSIEGSGGIAGFNPENGQPVPVDWSVQVNAPAGDYVYFCYIHPGMSGTLHVVPSGQSASTQADIDRASDQQFKADQAAGLAAEQQYSVDQTTVEGSTTTGITTTHHVSVGVSAANNHVAIDEMLPQRIKVAPGDQVEFKWRDGHNVHTVGIAQAESQLPEPFVFDCGSSFVSPPSPEGAPGGICTEPAAQAPELVGDPGNAISGSVLKSVQGIYDSGLLIGGDYGVQPTVQTWSVRTNGTTEGGNYNYWCSVHDFMHGVLIVGT
jgi:plastocyanin